MTPSERVTFRLPRGYVKALAALAEEMEVNTSEALRTLIAAEVDRRGWGGQALLDRLIEEHGPGAVLTVSVDGPIVDEPAINGQPLEGASVALVFGAAGRAELVLDDDDGPSSLTLTELVPQPGKTLSVTVNLDTLNAD